MNQNMLLNMLMNRLQQQNPQAYSQINQWMSSGKNAEDIISQLVQSGQVTSQQLNQAKGLLSNIQNDNQRRF